MCENERKPGFRRVEQVEFIHSHRCCLNDGVGKMCMYVLPLLKVVVTGFHLYLHKDV